LVVLLGVFPPAPFFFLLLVLVRVTVSLLLLWLAFVALVGPLAAFVCFFPGCVFILFPAFRPFGFLPPLGPAYVPLPALWCRGLALLRVRVPLLRAWRQKAEGPKSGE
jgi:hypothetical protein